MTKILNLNFDKPNSYNLYIKKKLLKTSLK